MTLRKKVCQAYLCLIAFCNSKHYLQFKYLTVFMLFIDVYGPIPTSIVGVCGLRTNVLLFIYNFLHLFSLKYLIYLEFFPRFNLFMCY